MIIIIYIYTYFDAFLEKIKINNKHKFQIMTFYFIKSYY